MQTTANAFKALTGALGSSTSQEEDVQILHERFKELEKVKEELLEIIELSKRKGRRPSRLTELWLAEVDGNEANWKEIQVEIQPRFRIFGQRPNPSLRIRISDMIEAVEELLKKGESLKKLVMEDKSRSGGVAGFPKPRSIGFDATFKLLMDSIHGNDAGVIGLCGMGGIGKTKLLQRLKEEVSHEESSFYAVAMVEACIKCTEEEIQSKLGKELGLEFAETEDRAEKRDGIYHYLKGKNFVIILDNLWEKFDLTSIGIPVPYPDSNSKVIISTRNSKVCAAMDIHTRIDVGCLPWKESWDLFTAVVDKHLLRSEPEMAKHAMTIVRRCGGHPLALETLAKSMMGKETCEEWEIAVKEMEEDPFGFPGMEEILGSLKRSYDHIKDEELKRCFLHCAIFEEDTPLLKSALSEAFMSHGVLEVEEGMAEAYCRGIEMIDELISMGMLEASSDNNGDDAVKMHRMAYHSALWIASECGRKKGSTLLIRARDKEEAPAADDAKWRDAQMISLVGSHFATVVLPSRPVCRALTSLILANNSSLEVIPEGFFEYMPSLEVLDLSRTPLKELPKEIGLLVNLRLLCLKNTKLVSLPEEVGTLRKLESLNIAWVPSLKTIPKNVISKLRTSLRVLDLFYGYRYWEVGSSMSGDRLLLEELEGLYGLRSLGITIDERGTLERLAAMEKLAMSVFGLHLSFMQGVESIGLSDQTMGGNMKNVTQLAITSSTDLQELVLGDRPSGLQSLQLMCLTKLQKIVYPNPPRSGKILERLTRLHISSCPRVEEVLDSDAEIVILPSLREVYLVDLQELRSICGNMSSLPCLTTLQVKDCPKLGKLPRGVGKSKSLKCIRGSQSWWEALEFQEEKEKKNGVSSLATLFKVLG